MGTSLIASLDTHRSISHYVTSLLAKKSHSSCHKQNAFSYCLELVVFIACARNDGFRSSARCPMSLGLQPCGGAGNPHPLQSMLIDVCVTSMLSLGSRIPAPLARYHTIVTCKGNHIKPPATRSPTQKYQSIVTHKFTSQKYHILENGLVPPCSILLPLRLNLLSWIIH